MLSKVTRPNPAWLGRIGCDAPELLVERVIQQFVSENTKEPVDFIVINGDFAAYEYISKNDILLLKKEAEDKWNR